MYVIKVRDPNPGPNQGKFMVLRTAKNPAEVKRMTANYRANGTKFRVELMRNQPKGVHSAADIWHHGKAR